MSTSKFNAHEVSSSTTRDSPWQSSTFDTSSKLDIRSWWWSLERTVQGWLVLGSIVKEEGFFGSRKIEVISWGSISCVQEERVY